MFPQTPQYLVISYRDHITNEEVKARIGNAIRPYEDLKRGKLKWYGHVTWSSGLAKTVLQGTVQGGRWRGRQSRLEETMGRQHQRVDWPWMEYHTTKSWELRGVGQASCKIYNGALTVSQTRIDKIGLLCQTSVITGSELRLVGPVSVYCDWVRYKFDLQLCLAACEIV